MVIRLLANQDLTPMGKDNNNSKLIYYLERAKKTADRRHDDNIETTISEASCLKLYLYRKTDIQDFKTQTKVEFINNVDTCSYSSAVAW